MDGTVRVWNLNTGQCVHTLTGHTSLVSLLGLSPNYLVSAAADSTLRIWDPNTGILKAVLAGHSGAITAFKHDSWKLVSGSDRTLKLWDLRNIGKDGDVPVVRDLLLRIIGVWQVDFEGSWCVASDIRNDRTMMTIWNFSDA